jgi:Flp pilus assembly pilin Flp
MKMMLKSLKTQSGSILTEYAFLLTLIAMVCIVAVAALGVSASGLFAGVSFSGS